MTFNQQFFDVLLRHHIDLLRFGSGLTRQINEMLSQASADIKSQIARRLGKNTGLDASGLRRLRELERAIVQLRSPAWNDVNALWRSNAVELAMDEAPFMAGALGAILPISVDFVMPQSRTLRALALERPFDGKPLAQWASGVQAADLVRIQQQIRIGMVQGESSADIASRVVGLKGPLEVSMRQAEAITRTLVNHVSNAAQGSFLSDNSELFEEEQLVATLDSRTTLLCASLDGKRSPVGEGPKPPLHVSCRSIVVPVLDGDVVGERPFVPAAESELLAEYADQAGIDEVSSRDALPRGHKGAYDEFRRARVRELTGTVPARTTYQEWLGRQSADFQDEVLGPTRGKLFREGGLALDRFVNRAGDELNLDELRARNSAAFERAGIKPKETQ